MQIVYLGVDIAKANFEAALWIHDEPTSLGKFANTPEGYSDLFRAVACSIKRDAVIQLVAESTGTYHLGLIGYAHEQEWQVSLPNAKIVRDWAKGQGTRVKHDRIDARILASYGAKEQPRTERPLPNEVLILSLLLNRQEDIEKTVQQEQNRLESFNQRPEVCQPVLDDILHSIQYAKERLLNIKQSIKDHLEDHPHLKQQRTHLLQVPGIGEKGVLKILVFLYRWDAHTCGQGNAKGITAFAGMDPVPFSSGSSVFKRPTISKMGDASIRQLLFMSALGGVRAKSSPLVAFYQRLIGCNKPKKVALVAAGRKILTWAFGVFRSGNPFDPALASAKTI